MLNLCLLLESIKLIDDNFKNSVLKVKLDKLLNGNSFNIIDFREIGKLMGVNVEQNPNYRYLRALHCVSYSDMPDNVINNLPSVIFETLMPRVSFTSLSNLLLTEGRDMVCIEDRYLN